ncbi:hypothetical protein [Terrisporobacter petrolearius]|uniref:hypothetical protein n=1 Tax=Terrisporobacter petrolearius TaxID=1460447 RepID=UPI003AFF8316
MKKSNVVSVRLDNKEMETLEIYSNMFNTNKPSDIIRGLLTMNPYLNILKSIIKNLDDKERKLKLIRLDFSNDKDFSEAINKKIEDIDLFRTEILRQIDDQINCISLVHSLIPKNDCSSNDHSDDDIDNYFNKVLEVKPSKSNSSNLDDSDFIDFDFDEQYEDVEGDELVAKYEEDEKNSCEQMQYRVRSFLKHF